MVPFRGTNGLAARNHALGRFQVVGIPSAPRGTSQVQITFTITECQILISAHDVNRKDKRDLQIQRGGCRHDAELGVRLGSRMKSAVFDLDLSRKTTDSNLAFPKRRSGARSH